MHEVLAAIFESVRTLGLDRSDERVTEAIRVATIAFEDGYPVDQVMEFARPVLLRDKVSAAA